MFETDTGTDAIQVEPCRSVGSLSNISNYTGSLIINKYYSNVGTQR